jgi:hypothetical protein
VPPRHERVVDVPLDARRVRIIVCISCLNCTVVERAWQIFREQLPGVFERYRRRTLRLGCQIRAVVRELVSRTGSCALSAPAVGISHCVFDCVSRFLHRGF